MRKTVFVGKYPLSEKRKRDAEILMQMFNIERQFEKKADRSKKLKSI